MTDKFWVSGLQVFLEEIEQGNWIRPEYSGLFLTKHTSEYIESCITIRVQKSEDCGITIHRETIDLTESSTLQATGPLVHHQTWFSVFFYCPN